MRKMRKFVAYLLAFMILIDCTKGLCLVAVAEGGLHSVVNYMDYETANPLPSSVADGNDFTFDYSPVSDKVTVHKIYAENKDSSLPINKLGHSNRNYSQAFYPISTSASAPIIQYKEFAGEDIAGRFFDGYLEATKRTESGSLSNQFIMAQNVNLFRNLPSEVSFGFWISGDSKEVGNIEIWLAYHTSNTYKAHVVLPVKTLIEGGKGATADIELKTSTEKGITDYSYSSATVLDTIGSEWYYISYSLTGLEYYVDPADISAIDTASDNDVLNSGLVLAEQTSETYTGADPHHFYLLLNNRLDNGNVKLMGLQLIAGDTITDPYVAYPTSHDSSHYYWRPDDNHTTLQVPSTYIDNTLYIRSYSTRQFGVEFLYDEANVEVTGDAYVEGDQDYTFQVAEKAGAHSDINDVSIIRSQNAENLNTYNGITNTYSLLPSNSGNGRYHFQVENIESDGAVAGNHIHRLTYDHVNAFLEDTSVYVRVPDVNLFKGKPSEAGLSFWVDADTIEKFGDKNLAFWLAYNTSYTFNVSINLQKLTSSVGTVYTIQPSSDTIFQSAEVKASCEAKVGDWYFVSLNLKKLSYQDHYDDTLPSVFYIIPDRAVSLYMQNNDTYIDFADFRLVKNSTLGMDYICKGNTVLQRLGIVAGEYTIDKTQIWDDLKIKVSTVDVIAPIIDGVEDGQEYSTTLSPDSSDNDIEQVTLTRDGMPVSGYTLGDEIKLSGNYVLEVVDQSGNKATVNFSIHYEYTVSKYTENAIITGNDTASTKTPYTFHVTKDDEYSVLQSVYMQYEVPGYTSIGNLDLYAIKNGVASKNQLYVKTVDRSANPIGGLWKESYELYYNTDLIPNAELSDSKWLRVNYELNETLPKDLSVSFWINLESFYDVYDNSSYMFNVWFLYSDEYPESGLVYNMPIYSMVENVGREFSMSPQNQMQSLATSLEQSCKCVTVADGWAYITATLSDIKYRDDFIPTVDNAFYITLNEQAGKNMFTDKTHLEIAGINLVSNGHTESPFIDYSNVINGVATHHLGTTEGEYTIDESMIVADFTVNARAINTLAPVITGVEEGGIYESATPSCTEDDVAVSLYLDGALIDFTFGTKLQEAGDYELIAYDSDRNYTYIRFTIIKQYQITFDIQNEFTRAEGDTKVTSGRDYAFNYSTTLDGVEISEAYLVTNWNGTLVSSDNWFSTAQEGGPNAPKIVVKDQSGSPIGGIYEKSISYSYNNSIPNANRTNSVYTNLKVTPGPTSAKPKVISTGFWVNTENVNALFPTDSEYFEIWLGYESSYSIIMRIHLGALIRNSGGNTVTLNTAAITSADTAGDVLEKKGDWAYVTLDLTDIVWSSSFAPSQTQTVYLTFNGCNRTLYDTGLSFEWTGLSVVTGDIIRDGKLDYSDSSLRENKVAFDAKFGLNKIEATQLHADTTIYLRVNDNASPVIEGVEDGQIYWIDTDNDEYIQPSSSDTDIKSVVLIHNGEEKDGYTLGELLNETGTYSLTLTDIFDNQTTVIFQIVSGGWIPVTQDTKFVTTDLPGAAKKGEDLTFHISLDGAENGITNFHEGYYSVSGFEAYEINSGNDTSAPKLWSSTADKNALTIRFVDNDHQASAELFPYKVKVDYTNTSTSAWIKSNATAWAEMPETVSIGFWVNDETVNNVFAAQKSWELWLIYAGGTQEKLSINLINAISAVGSSGFATTNKTIFETATVESKCLAKEGGWSYITVNISDITYRTSYISSLSSAAAYLIFTSQSAALAQHTFEFAGMSIVFGAERGNAYALYPETADGEYKGLLRPSTADTFTIPAEDIIGPLKVVLKADFGSSTATMSPIEVTYDKYYAVSEDVVFTVHTNGDIISDIFINATALKEGSDYTVTTMGAGLETVKTYTIKRAFLDTLALGTYTVRIAATVGDDVKASLHIVDTSQKGDLPVSVTTSGEYIYIRTTFNDTKDLVQAFRPYQATNLLTQNAPLNFASSYLLSKFAATISSGTVLSGHGDEATPFNFNSSYMGANHGQSDAIEVTLPGHGKTYADIGSQWIDESGVKWDLLRITGNTLMFLSYSADKDNYKFTRNPSGDFTHLSDAVNTESIAVSSATVTTAVQVQPAIGNKRIEVYAVKDGEKYLLTENAPVAYCDYVVMEEYYDILNPSTIADALRENRPEGGYTENPSTGVGEPIIRYHMTHHVLADGTVIEIMDHKILKKVNFNYYGGIQYQQQNRAFGGNVLRYIPGIQNMPEVDFGQADSNHQIVPGSVTLNSSYWSDPAYNPDRQLDFIQNADGSNNVTFVGGYLPYYYNETPAKRIESSDRWGFVYSSNKVYPAYITAKAGIDKFNNQEVKGIAYKKYFDSSEQSINDSSYYTIEYDGYTFLYYDGINADMDEIVLTPELLAGESELIYKTANVEYSHDGDSIKMTTSGEEKSMVSLKITPAQGEVHKVDFVAEGNVITTYYVENGTELDAVPEVPVKKGYSGSWDKIGVTITGDTTVTAVYTINTYDIIYNYEGGETVENPSVYTVITPTITLLNPSRQGYIFSGWYHEETDEKIESIPLGSVGNLSLYAVWEPKGTITIHNGQQTDIYGDVGFEIISDQTTIGFLIQYKIEGEWSTTVPVAVGVYDVMITREECEKYLPFSINIPEGLKVVKATPSVTFTDIDKTFNGERISVDHAVFTGAYGESLSGSVSYQYYSDAACENELSLPPINVGTYYVTASIEESQNYNTLTTEPIVLNILEAVFNVTLPTALPISVNADGVVNVADDVFITNNRDIPVIVTNIEILAKNGWTQVFDKQRLRDSLINARTFYLDIIAPSKDQIIGKNASLKIEYDADVAAQSVNITDENVADVIFTVGWYVAE